MKNGMKRTASIEYGEDGEQYLVFDDETIKELGWEVGDDIEWIDNGNGTWTLEKK
jgi:hypothetical protein